MLLVSSKHFHFDKCDYLHLEAKHIHHNFHSQLNTPQRGPDLASKIFLRIHMKKNM